MVSIVELLVLLIVVLAAIFVFYSLNTVKHLIVNTILGLIILALSNFAFHLGIKYTIWVILVCAIGGIPGSILVIILHVLHIAF